MIESRKAYVRYEHRENKPVKREFLLDNTYKEAYNNEYNYVSGLLYSAEADRRKDEGGLLHTDEAAERVEIGYRLGESIRVLYVSYIDCPNCGEPMIRYTHKDKLWLCQACSTELIPKEKV